MSALASRLAFVVSALGRRRRRTLTLGTGVALVTALVAADAMLSSSLRRELAAGHEAMPDLVVQSLVGGRPAVIDGTRLDGFRDRPGVRAVRPRVFGYVYVPSIEANVTVVSLRDRARGDRVIDGRLPSGPRELVLGRVLADALGLRPGDVAALPVEGRFESFRVVGTFRGATSMRTADVILASDADARALLGLPTGVATDVAIDLTTPLEAPAVAREIREVVPNARVLDKAGIARTHALTLGARSGLVLATILPALLALLLVAWDRLTGLDETERREIAVLKVVGWSTADVLFVRLLESAATGLAGACAGFALGYVFVFHLGAPVLGDALFGWSRLAPALTLTPAFEIADVLALLSLVVLPFSLAGLVPDYRAAMRDPAESLRQA